VAVCKILLGATTEKYIFKESVVYHALFFIIGTGEKNFSLK